MDPLGYKPLGSSKAWTYLSSNGPISYDACKTIDWRINLTGAPTGALSDTQRIIDVIARQTGYAFAYRGQTKEIAFKNGRRDTQPYGQTLTISWASEKQVNLLAGGVVGRGGPGLTINGITGQGAVALDNGPWLARYPAAERRDLVRTLIAHELGHAFGLDHVVDPNQAMKSGLTMAQRGVFEAGDLQGLYENGAHVRGCGQMERDPELRDASARTDTTLRWIIRQ